MKQEQLTFTIRQGVVIGVYPGTNSLDVEQQLTGALERYLFTFSKVNRERTNPRRTCPARTADKAEQNRYPANERIAGRGKPKVVAMKLNVQHFRN